MHQRHSDIIQIIENKGILIALLIRPLFYQLKCDIFFFNQMETYTSCNCWWVKANPPIRGEKTGTLLGSQPLGRTRDLGA